MEPWKTFLKVRWMQPQWNKDNKVHQINLGLQNYCSFLIKNINSLHLSKAEINQKDHESCICITSSFVDVILEPLPLIKCNKGTLIFIYNIWLLQNKQNIIDKQSSLFIIDGFI